MKLKILREHYSYRNTPEGKVWVPKKAFKSEEDIKQSDRPIHNYNTYVCKVCNSIHITRKNYK